MHTIGGNICFYPHEKIIRFVNKYVRKKQYDGSFKNVMNINSGEWDCFASLDLGCGIGRHVDFLDDFKLNPYGIDLSDTAIEMGKNWFHSKGKEYLSQRLMVESVAELPFDNDYFNICVSHGVLDSMPRDIAIKGIAEVYRVLKPGALMYCDLIMSKEDKEEVQKDGYEKDTIQSYFDVNSVKSFFGDGFRIIEFKIIVWENEEGIENNRRAHLIIQKI